MLIVTAKSTPPQNSQPTHLRYAFSINLNVLTVGENASAALGIQTDEIQLSNILEHCCVLKGNTKCHN